MKHLPPLPVSSLLSLALLAFPYGCGPANAPGPQDDVVVNLPGVSAKSDDNGVTVKAPLGIEVTVGRQGVAVKAPGVKVDVDAQRVGVKAPGVKVDVDEQGVAVKAPGVDVQSDDEGLRVDAPLGVQVRIGAAPEPTPTPAGP